MDRSYCARVISLVESPASNVATMVMATGVELKMRSHKVFGGSADGLVMNLVETHKLTPEKLAELQRLVEEDHANE